jgi:hypothetical protein
MWPRPGANRARAGLGAHVHRWRAHQHYLLWDRSARKGSMSLSHVHRDCLLDGPCRVAQSKRASHAYWRARSGSARRLPGGSPVPAQMWAGWALPFRLVSFRDSRSSWRAAVQVQSAPAWRGAAVIRASSTAKEHPALHVATLPARLQIGAGWLPAAGAGQVMPSPFPARWNARTQPGSVVRMAHADARCLMRLFRVAECCMLRTVYCALPCWIAHLQRINSSRRSCPRVREDVCCGASQGGHAAARASTSIGARRAALAVQAPLLISLCVVAIAAAVVALLTTRRRLLPAWAS